MKPIMIINNLYLGNVDTAKDIMLLQKHGIKAIINISAGAIHFPSEFIYLKVHLLDKSDSKITDHINTVINFINDNIQKGGVLVHCKAGMSRSPSFIFAYLMHSEMKMEADTALKLLKEKRPEIRPKKEFIDAITLFI